MLRDLQNLTPILAEMKAMLEQLHQRSLFGATGDEYELTGLGFLYAKDEFEIQHQGSLTIGNS